MGQPVRILISKIGLDGHDRGAKLIVRALRDAGMEVIYTGLWQTPAATVHAALQEDVDVIGVSLLSAAHMTIMPEVVRQSRELGMAHVPVVVGGIIPEEDHQPLRDKGIAAVYNPGTSMEFIANDVRRLAEERRAKIAADKEKIDLASMRGLARAITHIMEGGEQTHVGQSADAPRACIGITGPPGVGKSTFIGRLARALRDRNHNVAVIAVDPTSPLTGGSLLGDRLRMMSGEPVEGLFVRSLASGGEAGGLGPHVAEIAKLFATAGYPIVLIETVGAGQNDVAVRQVADEVLLLMMPGSGDAVQFAKAGVVEIATGFVLNKADLDGADKTAKDLRETLEDARPIWPVSSLRGEGLEPLCDWVEQKLSG